MNEQLWGKVIGGAVQWGSLAIALFAILHGWKNLQDRKLEETKIKAKENSLGETAIKKMNERVEEIYLMAKGIEKICNDKHESMMEHLRESTKDLIKILKNKD